MVASWVSGYLIPNVAVASLFASVSGIYTGTYLIGAYRNLIELSVTIWYKARVLLIVFFLMPFAIFAEGFAVLWGLTQLDKGFYVVQKDSQED